MTPESHLIQLSQDGPTDGPTDLIRLCLFDWAVCAIAGGDEPVSQLLAKSVDPHMALLLGTMGHALDYDDTHFDHIGHTSAVVMPAVLAVAKAQKITDMTRIAHAALVGSEAAVRIGLWLGRDHYQIGFHQTATSGAIGAAVGCAHLRNLTAAETLNAIGLAATGASGLKGQFGTMGKPLNAGLAARCGAEAALWAQAGMTSDPAGLTQFGATHHGQANAAAWDRAERWKIARISHKFHACCHGLHAMLEALAGVTGEVSAVNIHTHPRWMTVCNQPSPKTGLGVKFSYAMTAAMTLHGVSTAAISNFSDVTANDPALIALRDKIDVISDETLSEMQTRVDVTYTNGNTQTLTHDLEAPLALETRIKRLKQKARAVVGADLSDQLWTAVQGKNLAPLTDLLT